MFEKRYISLLLCCLFLLLTIGCGTDTKTEFVQSTAPASTYLVEYIPGMMSAAEGKTTFDLRIMKRSDGSLVTNLTSTGLSIAPRMYMNNGKNHATPTAAIKNNTDGTYACTVYYLMASAMSGTMGPMPMGHWELAVSVGTEKTSFYPYVEMAMGSNTPKVTLKGQADSISSMTGTEKRSYYLFRDAVTTGATSTFTVFVAAKESMDNYPAVTAGAILTSPSGTWVVSSPTTTLQASTDLATWIPGTDNGAGIWTVAGLSGISSSGTSTVYVSLTVNSEVKTSDGLASSGSNTYQAFTITMP